MILEGGKMAEKELGVITETFLGHEDHGIFTFVLFIDFGSSGQGFGIYCLSYRPNGDTEHYSPLIGEAIGKICSAVGVDSWEKLKGRTVYVERDVESGLLCSIEAPKFVEHGPAYNIKDHLGKKVDY